MLESWELPHHAGSVTTNRIGKIYFVGTAGGGVEPFLGFGQVNAIVSGVMAARSIIKRLNINFLLKDLKRKGPVHPHYHLLRVVSWKQLLKGFAFKRCFVVKFIAYPLFLNVVFPFQFFDNTFADKTKGSNIIRENCQVNANSYTSIP